MILKASLVFALSNKSQSKQVMSSKDDKSRWSQKISEIFYNEYLLFFFKENFLGQETEKSLDRLRGKTKTFYAVDNCEARMSSKASCGERLLVLNVFEGHMYIRLLGHLKLSRKALQWEVQILLTWSHFMQRWFALWIFVPVLLFLF